MLRTLALSILSLSLLAATPSSAPIPGFSEAASRGQREAEAKFDASLKKANLREWNRNLSARPHFVGAPFTKESAEWIASMFRSWGYDTAVAAWDAEEPGLLGSTEWVEAHAAELEAKAVAYINSDSNGRGFLGMSGSHTLEPFINDVARDVVDPQKRISVFDRARAARLVGADAKERREIRETRDLPIGALGSGSDYTPFFQHLGIASLNIGFGGENQGGSYHSIYDSFDHYSRFGDPNFDYGITLAQVGGRATLRLANADVLPFDFSAFARTVSRYADEVEALTETMRNETAERNRLIAEGSLDAAHDPTLAWKAPVTREEVPHLNFAPVKNAVARLQAATASYQKARANRGAIPPETETRLNALLRNAERTLTRPERLPRRSWFRHQVYAPGFYTGYGVKTLPGIREAIEQRNWSEAEQQIGVASAALDRFTTLVREAETVIAQP
ncbi:MAG: transferrin receptor-like dimerization domain-containing protein [Thermoanaerobaculia bacterium]